MEIATMIAIAALQFAATFGGVVAGFKFLSMRIDRLELQVDRHDDRITALILSKQEH